MLNALSRDVAAEHCRTAAPLTLVVELCHALDRVGVKYCHWKSTNALDRSAAGENDLDLLIARSDASKCSSVLSQCGFKLAQAPPDKVMPGVLDYFGYDGAADKWVHVHAHFQLVAGHDLSKNYRLPVEGPFLASAIHEDLFWVPAPEFEFIVFVIRMVLKHVLWDAVLGREGRLKSSEQRELSYLRDRVDVTRLEGTLIRHFPFVETTVFWECVEALAADSSTWCRIRAGHALESRLRAHARRPRKAEFLVRVARRIASAVRRRAGRAPQRYRLAAGGASIAVVGGDGAGKSTGIEGLHRWLSEHFETASVHLGKPAWSPLTVAVRTLLKIGQLAGLYGVESSLGDTLAEKSLVSPGYPWLLREICRARDRYRTYARARRRVARGAVVIFDRFPLPQIQLMDGPQTRRFVRELADAAGATCALRPRAQNRLVNFLIQVEEDFYRPLVCPELLIVLRVDPDTAVRRKPDERASHVRERSAEIWKLNWQHTGAVVVDATRSRADVLAELKACVWAKL